MREKIHSQVNMAMEDAFNLGIAYQKGEIDTPKLEVGYHVSEILYELTEIIDSVPCEEREGSSDWGENIVSIYYNQHVKEVQQWKEKVKGGG